MTIEIEAIRPDLGAHIRASASDLARDDGPQIVLDALDKYGVLVFPQIGMSDEQFLTLTGALGKKHDEKGLNDGSNASGRGMLRVALDKEDKTQLDFIRGNNFWHMDGTAYDVPGKATLLKCEDAPSEGGDTGFANLFAAYAALPDARKRELAGLRVVHCLASVMRKVYDEPSDEDFVRWNGIFPEREHPLVWRQKNGRTSLLIGSTAGRIADMDEDEGRELLEDLLEWCTQDRFVYRHRWRSGDLVIFNNPGMLHRSYPYTLAAGRVMHRTTLAGVEAIA